MVHNNHSLPAHMDVACSFNVAAKFFSNKMYLFLQNLLSPGDEAPLRDLSGVTLSEKNK